VVPRVRRERTTLEGAGQCSLKAAVYHRNGGATPLSGTELITTQTHATPPPGQLNGTEFKEKLTQRILFFGLTAMLSLSACRARGQSAGA